jgi:hypothetical protein
VYSDDEDKIVFYRQAISFMQAENLATFDQGHFSVGLTLPLVSCTH